MSGPGELEDVRESRRIVRAYSWEVEQRLPPDSDAFALGQVLHSFNEQSVGVSPPWQRFFEVDRPDGEDNPVTRIIAVESAALRKKWARFYESRPKPDRLDLEAFEPSIEGIIDFVKATEVSWASRRKEGWRGKVMSQFHGFCGTLHAHSAFIKILPEGNEYVSVFTGTLNVILKASVNHERIAKSFAEILEAISDQVARSQREMQLYRTPEILAMVADLYAHIFLLLSSIMDWIMQKTYKRLLDSFRETLQEQFEEEVQAIQKKAMTLRYAAEQISRAELRATRETGEGTFIQAAAARQAIEDTRGDLRAGLLGAERTAAEVTHLNQKVDKMMEQANSRELMTPQQLDQLARRIMNMLQYGATNWKQVDDGVANAAPGAGVFGRGLIAADAGDSSGMSSENVSYNSRSLEDYFDRSWVRPEDCLPGPVSLDELSLRRLSGWMASTESSFLWLECLREFPDAVKSPMTRTAFNVVSLADEFSIQVISFSCEAGHSSFGRSHDDIEAQACIGLGYALLRQLIEFLLARFVTDCDLSESRFERLNGRMDSWPELLSLLKDVLDLMKGTVLCVIDGLNWLDDKSTDRPLAQLVRTLRHAKLKVLFTTTGRSGCLLDELSVEEREVVNFKHLKDAALDLALE